MVVPRSRTIKRLHLTIASDTLGAGTRTAAATLAGEANVRKTGEKVEITPIGTIRSPFTDPEGMPIQPVGAPSVRGQVEVLPAYQDGLRDLDGFSHVILLYLFHRSRGFELKVVPFLDTTPRGVFATRAPKRPNPIGLSVVQLERIEGRILHVAGIDVLDGTPLLDIKPYVPDFDEQVEVRTGWLEEVSKRAKGKRADDRFA